MIEVLQYQNEDLLNLAIRVAQAGDPYDVVVRVWARGVLSPPMPANLIIHLAALREAGLL